MKRLIAAGALLDPVDQRRQTPLLIAVEKGQYEAAALLIQAGADINAHAENMDTPWLLAGALGRTEMLRLMIPKGPDLSLRNRFGGNALIPACERGHVDTVKVLLTTKIDVNHVNNLGWTCLLEAVILGDGGPRYRDVTKLVLAAGANPNIADGRRFAAHPCHAQRAGRSCKPDQGGRRTVVAWRGGGRRSVSLRAAVWTGYGRDTRPISDIAATGILQRARP